jgi:hypothetical protein
VRVDGHSSAGAAILGRTRSAAASISARNMTCGSAGYCEQDVDS